MLVYQTGEEGFVYFFVSLFIVKKNIIPNMGKIQLLVHIVPL